MRNTHLKGLGLHIIRFSNFEVLQNTEQVIDQIKNKIINLRNNSPH